MTATESHRTPPEDAPLEVDNAWRYACEVIRGFADRDTERLFRREAVRRWSPDLQHAALRKLVVVDAAEAINDLRMPPGNRLERLAGKRSGQYSIRVNDQRRLCFRWRDRDAFDVELVDYR